MTAVHLISLGAGVQSSCMALMAAHGLIQPHPVAAIFADTQAEPASIYRWLDQLETMIAQAPHPFPVHRVTRGDLAKALLTRKPTKDGRKTTVSDIPFFTLSAAGQQGQVPQRACTADYKIKPILRKARELGGIKRGQKTVGVVQWIGISLDEIQRMKPSREAWAESRWPLVEQRMKRHDCLRWMEANGYPKPPRSSCVFCPYHNDREWRRLKTEEPAEFEKAVQFEKAGTNMSSTPYLHRSCRPLGEIDFSTEEERGQGTLWQDNFTAECEGMCGV